jgi:hypothetical protein
MTDIEITPPPAVIAEIAPPAAVIVEITPVALPASGSGSGAQQVFVQPSAPTAAGPFIWVQTGLAPAGAGFTFWFEDGL